MANSILKERLAGIRGVLLKLLESGQSLSSSSKGNEREAFVAHVLGAVIGPPYRIGDGDIIDVSGKASGQMDCVIEYAGSISFPVMKDLPRLYLAEGVVAVVEVKSDVAGQWDEVLKSHAKLAPLRRNVGAIITHGHVPNHIPHFVVGYRGWSKTETLREKIRESGVEGILCLEQSLYCSKSFESSDEFALYCLMLDIEALTSSMIAAKPRFLDYAK